MFANLIESQSHGKEFKRRGRFVLATAAAYTVLFFVAGIVSIYAYDARLDAKPDDLEVLIWVPPVAPVTPNPPRDVQPIHRQNRANAPVDRNITVSERRQLVSSVADPRSTPETVGITAPPDPPAMGLVRLTGRNVDPQPSGDRGDCVTCSG